jgi:uncharacterized protein RhaS with RHS repeats
MRRSPMKVPRKAHEHNGGGDVVVTSSGRPCRLSAYVSQRITRVLEANVGTAGDLDTASAPDYTPGFPLPPTSFARGGHRAPSHARNRVCRSNLQRVGATGSVFEVARLRERAGERTALTDATGREQLIKP